MPQYFSTDYTALDPDLRKEAAASVKALLSEKESVSLRNAIKTDPESWWTGFHFIQGARLRTELEVAGFTAERFGVDSLDDIWMDILYDAVI